MMFNSLSMHTSGSQLLPAFTNNMVTTVIVYMHLLA